MKVECEEKMSDENGANVEEEEIQHQNVLSICWDSSILSAVYYDLTLLELHVIRETTDFRPEFPTLMNAIEEIDPVYLIIGGSESFFQEIYGLMSVDDDGNAAGRQNLNYFKSTNPDNLSNIAFYIFDRKSQKEEYLRTIYNPNCVAFAGLSKQTSADSRQRFINSLLPMGQELTVIALGNLIRYLRDNCSRWKHAFTHGNAMELMITNVSVHTTESCVMVDDATMNSLLIFSKARHPSNFKKRFRNDGLSIYTLLNLCVSSMGRQELKMMLQKPTCDFDEIQMRLNTIEWCLKQQNFRFLVDLTKVMKNIINVNAIYNRIILDQSSATNWNSLIKGIYNCFLIVEMCSSLPPKSIEGTLFTDLSEKFSSKGRDMKNLLTIIKDFVDVEEIQNQKRFVAKYEIDEELEEAYTRLQDFLNGLATLEHKTTTDDGSKISENSKCKMEPLEYISEIGIVSKVIGDEILFELLRKAEGIEIALQIDNVAYVRTLQSKELDDTYDLLMADLVKNEMKIFARVMEYLNKYLYEIVQINKIAAKLDVLMSLASISRQHKFVRPIFTKEKKLKIINGRHPLTELSQNYTPSTTEIVGGSTKFINIISAPNSSGKSVYIKQVALICYLAHVGSFVPADECELPILDAIYAQIHSNESSYQCESSFLLELNQMSKIMRFSSSNSLVLIDEFGKGTQTQDAVALLTAMIEHLSNRGDRTPFTFIITHFPQIFDLIQENDFIQFKTIVTREVGEDNNLSKFHVVNGVNNQPSITKDSAIDELIRKIFKSNKESKKFLETRRLNEIYSLAVSSFILVLMRMFIRKKIVTFEFIDELHSKVDIEDFLN